MVIEIPPIQVHGSRSLVLFFIPSLEKYRKFTKVKGEGDKIVDQSGIGVSEKWLKHATRELTPRTALDELRGRAYG